MTLTCELRINVGMSNKPLSRPGVRKCNSLIPNHHTTTTRFNAHQIHSWPCYQMELNWKQKTVPLCREGGGIGWLSAKPSHLYAPPYSWNGWMTADLVAEGSPLLKAVQGAATQCNASWDSSVRRTVDCHATGSGFNTHSQLNLVGGWLSPPFHCP